MKTMESAEDRGMEQQSIPKEAASPQAASASPVASLFGAMSKVDLFISREIVAIGEDCQ
jgi:hypothetical protein